LERELGNLLVYHAATVVDEEPALRRLGGISGQYLGHEHEAGPELQWAGATFGAELVAHEAAADAVREQRAELSRTFAARHRVDDDFEIVPIPGHTPGSAAYLWDSGEERVLFTADSVYWLEGRWIGVLLDEAERARFLESLEQLAALDFDVVVPWVAQAGDPPHRLVDRASADRLFDEIIDRIHAGENR
jgi:glyoxylase-like metal-dependent hydrolase (beta-lactamase superfamily II)